VTQEPVPAVELAAPEVTPEIIVVTGLSGAGRSTAAKCLEDLGWFVVDNLPPALLGTMTELAARSQGAVSRLAIVLDVRSRAFSSDLRSALTDLRRRGTHPRVLFLEAGDEVLVRRFENVRRPHPLAADGRLVEGIAAERELLRELKADADLVLDTSGLNVHQLRAKIDQAFDESRAAALRATVLSFGYKYGLPVDADLVADVRFLPNPHWIPELRPLFGTDPEVSSYVLGLDPAREFLETYHTLLRIVGAGYQREGKRYLTLAVGCTGGKHRSVAIAEELSRRLAEDGVDTRVLHRDLGRE
jgi:UPF0042 nucleotide-binding protein